MEYAKGVKKIRTVILAIVLIVAVLYIGLNSVYTLDVEHQAVIETLGIPSAETQPGLHFKIPYIQKLHKVDTTIKGMSIGYNIETNEDILSESIMISSDYNFLNIDFYLEYQVSNPIDYLYCSDDPINILKSTTQNCIRTVIASYNVDSILTTGKSEIQANIKSMLIDKIDKLNIGISVRNITIQDSEPPNKDVDEAFKAVGTAKQNKETAINNANKYRNEQLPIAKAEVDRILQEAEAAKSERIAEAQGQVARFESMYNEYVKYPINTRERMFYETMEDLLPNMKIVIQGGEGTLDTVFPLEKFSDITVNSNSASSNNTNSTTTAEE